MFLVLMSWNVGAQETASQLSSKLYRQYNKKYKELVVYSGSGYGTAFKARVFARKRGYWKVFDHYMSKVHLADSIVVRKKISKRYMDSFLVANKVLELNDEKALNSPCVEHIDSLGWAQYGRLGRSLDNIYDIAEFGIEFNWKGQRRRIVYRDPWEALKICPYSQEREAFRIALMAIQNLK